MIKFVLQNGVADYSYSKQVAEKNGAPVEFMKLLTFYQADEKTAFKTQWNYVK